ncbi:MAG: SDR family NAD(P)-dependent oxidoreductase [Bacteroidetes bacterium]|nr:SDR family NAD(P)-dependent oxidoreductase [Bacteroidota bacterium]
MSKVIVIIGAGKGISLAVAEKFGKEGFSVVLISRREEKLEELQKILTQKNIPTQIYVGDAGDSDSIKDAFDRIWEQHEHIDVVHYNVAKRKKVNIAEETADGLTRDFKINVASVMTAVNLVLPDMEKKGEGAILISGGGYALVPNPDLGSLSIGKAGIRNLAHSLHLALKPRNIFVGTLTICNHIEKENEKYNFQNVAEQFWKLYSDKKDFEIQF